MRVTIEPLVPRSKAVCEEHGYEFDVLAVDKLTILVRSIDGEWQGSFHNEEAYWDPNLLKYGETYDDKDSNDPREQSNS